MFRQADSAKTTSIAIRIGRTRTTAVFPNAAATGIVGSHAFQSLCAVRSERFAKQRLHANEREQNRQEWNRTSRSEGIENAGQHFIVIETS
jgi:hypothetical protein